MADSNDLKATSDETSSPASVSVPVSTPSSSNDANELKQDEEVLTMVDVLNEEQQLEEDIQAVLGASDDKNCTYSAGYVKRQALYTCTTCIPSGSDVNAGICLACSYKCHENHTLVELYTKRQFRCDCGNKKFPQPCRLEPIKDDTNDANVYNQNFKGVYCTCHRPYPDPDDTVNDEMLQCCVCEDWYHLRHLERNGASAGDFDEVVCHLCMGKFGRLNNYVGLAGCGVERADESKSVDVVGDNGVLEKDGEKSVVENGGSLEVGDKTDVEVSTSTAAGKMIDENQTNCRMPKLTVPQKLSTTFWPGKWRSHLCSCSQCKQYYDENKIAFLLDEEDTVANYEDKGKNTSSQYEAGMEALSSLDRVQQVEVISEYNNMMEHLKGYLAKFAESRKVVREEDIREFFSGMQAKKRQRLEVPPRFCR